MNILSIILVSIGVLAFTKALLIVRGVRIFRLKNESTNIWLTIAAATSAITVLFMDKPNYILLFPVLNVFLLFAFYLQPTFRVSKYLAFFYLPINIVFIVLLTL